MTLQKRLNRLMKRRGWRVANLARELERPYTSVREWVLHGRKPSGPAADRRAIERRVAKLEQA